MMADNYMMMNNNYLPAIQRYPSTNLPGPQNVFSMQQQSRMPTSISQQMSTPAVATSSIAANMLGYNQQMPTATSLCEHQGFLPVQTDTINETVPFIHQSLNCVVSSMSNTPTVSSVTGFTFTTPTQSYLYSPTLTSTTQSRFYNPNIGGRTFAPTGCSATWQHTVPQRMPWITNQQGINVFTGINTDTVCSVSLTNSPAVTHSVVSDMYAVPSCSGMSTKHKRRHGNDNDDSREEYSPGTKIHLTEERIARHMQGLRIHTQSPPLSDVNNLTAIHDNLVNNYQQSQQGSSLSTGAFSHSASAISQSPDGVKLTPSLDRWENYQQLEERLDPSDDEMTEADTKTDKQPRLHVNLSNLPKSVETNPVIPKDILEKIMNPCREVVLWSPPGGVFKLANNEASTSAESDASDDSSNAMEACEQTQSVELGCEMMVDGMEMDSCEYSLDL